MRRAPEGSFPAAGSGGSLQILDHQEEIMAHTVTCSADWCPEFSVRVGYVPSDPESEASAHRESLAEDGWTDVEGRDYCPDHSRET